METPVSAATLVPTLGLLLLGGLHFFDPDLDMTWSFAHLGRSPWRIPLASALLVLIPIALQWLWTKPDLRVEPKRLPKALTAGWFLVLWALLIFASQIWPAPDVVPDAHFLPNLIQEGSRMHRYFLVSHLYGGLYSLARDFVSPHDFVRILNAAFSAATFLFVFDAARILSRSRAERWTLVAIFWTAFGNLQLVLGYTDVYPVAQFFTVFYIWTCLRFFAGEMRLELCIVPAALAPFVHPSLIFLAPSLAIPALVAWRRPGGGSALLRTVFLGALIGFGLLFFEYGALSEPSKILASKGWGKYTWKPNEFDALRRFEEVVHGILLVDGVGLVLLLAAVSTGFWKRWGDRGWFFLALILLQVGYAFRLRPHWGAFVDWDSISVLAVPLSFFAGYFLIMWSRTRRKLGGLLIGLALAVSVVHLMARLNALDEDFQAHKKEAPPYHDKRAGRRYVPHGPMEGLIEQRWRTEVAIREQLRRERSPTPEPTTETE